MGRSALDTVGLVYNLKFPSLLKAVESAPIKLPDAKLLFPVFHCSGLGIRNRKFELQKEDWGE